jgi:3-(3-hydroxy-phenyl)propionate hydroxylase
MQQTGVIVAGGGPVGLCLALLLAEQGVDVTLVESEAVPTRELRASTFHPPTLDMLDRIGVGQALLAAGLPCPDWQVRLHPSGDRAVFDLGILAEDTAHPYRVQCEQWKLSDVLRARLEGRAELKLGARVIGFTQDEDGVAVEVEEAGEVRKTITAAFLAGCDGARSTVRAGLGLPFAGETYPETTLLATTRFPFEAHLAGLSNVTYCWREGARNFTLLRAPDFWRVSIYPREDLPLEPQMAPDAIEAALQAIVPRGERYEVDETRPYRVHMRMVERYAIGRVALAGDAAHVNSPAGGMGLNGGIHDAFELAASFVAAFAGDDHARLLDRYDRRRRPVARDEIMAQADRNRARMREQDPERRRALLAELQAITEDPARLRAYLLRSSMIEGLRRAANVA